MGPATMDECLICFGSVLGSIVESSEVELLKLSRVSKVSAAIYQVIPLSNLPPNLLCKGCQLALNTCVDLLDDLEKLQRRYEVLVESVRNKLVRSYYNNIQNHDDERTSQKEKGSSEIQRIRKAYAQCWSSCFVRISSRDACSEADFHKPVDLEDAPEDIYSCPELDAFYNDDSDAQSDRDDNTISYVDNPNLALVKQEIDDIIKPGFMPDLADDDLGVDNYDDAHSEPDFTANSPDSPADENQIDSAAFPAVPVVKDEENSKRRHVFASSSGLKSHKISNQSNSNHKQSRVQMSAERSSSSSRCDSENITSKDRRPIRSQRKRTYSSDTDIDCSDTNESPLRPQDDQSSSSSDSNEILDRYASPRKRRKQGHAGIKNCRNDREIRKERESTVCKVCHQTFSRWDALRVHIQRKHSGTSEKFRCDKCRKQFIYQGQFARHFYWHENSGKCPACHRLYETWIDFDKHLKAHVAKKTFVMKSLRFDKLDYSANPCKALKSTPTEPTIIQNNSPQNSEDEQNNNCSECGKTFNTSWALRRHMLLKHTANHAIFRCKKCSQEFYTEAQFSRHYFFHTNSAKCPACDEIHETWKDFDNHLKAHITNDTFVMDSIDLSGLNANIAVPPAENGKHFCNQCGQSFTTNRSIVVHIMRKHTRQSQQLQCPTCEKTFLYALQLARHKVWHETSGKCPTCEAVFTDRNKFDVHLKAHIKSKTVDIKPKEFPCEHCSKVFRRSSRLLSHQKVHIKKEALDIPRSEESNSCPDQNSGNETTASQDCPDTNKPIRTVRKRARVIYKDTDDTDSADESSSEKNQIHSEKMDLKDSKSLRKRPNRYKRKDKLRKQDEPAVCKECDKTFSRLSALHVHIYRMHSAIKEQLRCGKCQKQFIFKGHFARHYFWHENSGKCPACDQSFKNWKTFDVHLKAHISSKKFEIKTVVDIPNPSESDQPSKDMDIPRQEPRYVFEAIPEDTGEFQCSVCEEPFTSRREHAAHLLLHPNGEKDFHCLECPEKFPVLVSLRVHVKRRHKKLKCGDCEKVFSELAEVFKHKREEHGFKLPRNHNLRKFELRFPCPVCGLKFTKGTELKKHLKSHNNNGEKTYNCVLCSESFVYQSELESHLAWHADGCPPLPPRKEPKFPCPLCPMKFNRQEFYDLHMRKHANPEGTISRSIAASFDDDKNLISFDCSACETTFTKSEHLSPEGEFQLLCQHGNCTCQAVYTIFPEYLSHHQMICTRRFFERQKATCHECGKTFTNGYGLKLHMATIHPKTNVFQCEVCGRGFDIEPALNAHMQTHNTEKNHQCDLCGAKFKNSHILREHKESHATEEAYFCEVCGKGFTRKAGLKQHMDTHIETAQVPCPICGKLFKTKNYMKNHIYLTHEKRRAPRGRRRNPTTCRVKYRRQKDEDSNGSD